MGVGSNRGSLLGIWSLAGELSSSVVPRELWVAQGVGDGVLLRAEQLVRVVEHTPLLPPDHWRRWWPWIWIWWRPENLNLKSSKHSHLEVYWGSMILMEKIGKRENIKSLACRDLYLTFCNFFMSCCLYFMFLMIFGLLVMVSNLRKLRRWRRGCLPLHRAQLPPDKWNKFKKILLKRTLKDETPTPGVTLLPRQRITGLCGGTATKKFSGVFVANKCLFSLKINISLFFANKYLFSLQINIYFLFFCK